METKDELKRNLLIAGAMLVAFLVLILIGVVCFNYEAYTEQQITNDVSIPVASYFEAIRTFKNPVALKDYLGFDCDGFYWIGPYMSTEMRHSTVGQRWHIDKTFFSHLISESLFDYQLLPEEQQLLIFTKENKPIAYALLERSAGDLLSVSGSFVRIETQLYSIPLGDTKTWKVNTIKP